MGPCVSPTRGTSAGAASLGEFFSVRERTDLPHHMGYQSSSSNKSISYSKESVRTEPFA